MYGEGDYAILDDLIDTQWNVNSNASYTYLAESLDLIDTQWNVNSDSVVHTSDKARFNRYIVECK